MKRERQDIAWELMAHYPHERVPASRLLPCVVTLTRVAPSAGLDGDNLQGSLKALRDGVADWLGVDDRDPRVRWVYGQRRGKYAVEVQIA